MLFSFCFFPGGFVGLLLGYSFYNFYLMIFESIEKAVRYKEKRKESKKNSNGVGQSIAIANHFQKRVNGNEKNDTTSNKQSQDGFWLEPNKKSNTNRSIFKKCVEVIGFSGFLLITFNETYVCFKRYSDYPKYTSNHFLKQNEVDFPSFTFCNNGKDAYKFDVLKVSFELLNFSI